MSSSEIILAEQPKIALFQISPQALAVRDEALAGAALIGKVENADQNTRAVRAHIELKRVEASFEKSRKQLKEPILEAGRQLDRVVSLEIEEVKKEMGRISVLTSEFNQIEMRRVAEEERLQREEIARIEREKQAEIARIAREQAERELAAKREAEEAERKAREEREAAAKLAREATNAVEREAAAKRAEESAKAAEAARIERERIAKESADKAAAEMQLANEKAQALTAAEAKPITATRATGQVVKTDWEIEVTNPFDLARFHPNCVKIEPKLGEIKRLLTEGFDIKGVKAKKVTLTGVRAGAIPDAINV